MNLYLFAPDLYSGGMRGALSSKGQVTIPKAVRDALGLQPGDILEFTVRGGEIIGRRKAEPGSWDHLLGTLADGRRTDDVVAELRPERAW